MSASVAAAPGTASQKAPPAPSRPPSGRRRGGPSSGAWTAKNHQAEPLGKQLLRGDPRGRGEPAHQSQTPDPNGDTGTQTVHRVDMHVMGGRLKPLRVASDSFPAKESNDQDRQYAMASTGGSCAANDEPALAAGQKFPFQDRDHIAPAGPSPSGPAFPAPFPCAVVRMISARLFTARGVKPPASATSLQEGHVRLKGKGPGMLHLAQHIDGTVFGDFGHHVRLGEQMPRP